VAPSPFFIDSERGRCFAVHHPAAAPQARALVLYLHPFAEEMNKSRRMAALQARAFAAAGLEVLQIDLQGCGDSSGEFAGASWQGWIDDALAGASWLRARAPAAPLWLWGLRAGCLVAAAAAPRLQTPCHLLFWQPSGNGKLVLQQFLRLRLAADLAGAQGKGVIDELRRLLAAGSAVEIAGYELPPALAHGLESATLAPTGGPGRLEWIELSSAPEAALLPASEPVLARWRAAGWTVASRVVGGPAFWQTLEIEEAPALLEASVQAIGA
jgi:uncharacterized protein